MTQNYHTHFLSRLERASDDEISFALSLYYDGESTREIIKLFALPDQADRLAIELSDGYRPSHAIITRDGSFVTCLGPGMKFGDLPVITQNKFSSLARKKEIILRERTELAGLMESNLFSSMVNNTILRVGRNFTREQFKAWSIVQPMMGSTTAKVHVSSTESVHNLLPKLQLAARKGRARNKNDRENLRRLWEAKWSQGHSAMLIVSSNSIVKKLSEIDGEGLYMFATNCLYGKTVPISLMGLWYAAKMGNTIFPHAKKVLIETDRSWDYADAAITLVAIALRHKRYKNEVLKLLKRKKRGMSGADSNYCEKVSETFSLCLTNSERVKRALDIILLQICGENSPIPDEIGRIWISHMELCFVENILSIRHMACLLIWMMSIEAEDFYMPEKYKNYKDLFYPYEEKYAISMIAAEAFDQLVPGVLKDKKKLGNKRNKPCHCGSGKKYKKCCFKKDLKDRESHILPYKCLHE